MSDARVPPRWFVRLAWSVHRGLYRLLGRRGGLWKPGRKGWGTLRLTTTGRRSGRPRSVILGYVDDGPDLVSLAMNGWSPGEPAWWLNLKSDPDATVVLKDGTRRVAARAATGEERTRLWARWREVDPKLDAFAALRPGDTAVVIFEPRS